MQTTAHLRQLAHYLRKREANALRGQPQQLQELELISDLSLLTKWFWLAAIVSAAVSFAALPVLMVILKILLPPILREILWFLVKVCMAGSVTIFGAALYLTLKPPSDI